MKTRFFFFSLFSLVVAFVLARPGPLSAQGTAFTYQGTLTYQGSLANGGFDLTFSLFDTNIAGNQLGSTITNLNVTVTNGLVTALLDFGANFPGAGRWLQLGVRTNGSVDNFTALSPRQQVTPSPYSITAANFTGPVADAQLSTNIPLLNGTNVFTGPVSSSYNGATLAMVPSGVIVLWSGSSAAIPAGWTLCNGQNGTPDLRDAFVVGAGNSYTVGQTGGATSHTHSVSANATTSVAGAHTHTNVTIAAFTSGPGSPHTHSTPVFTTSSDGAHTHGGGTLEFSRNVSLPGGGSTSGGTFNFDLSSGNSTSGNMLPDSWGGATASAGAHTHTIAANTTGAESSHTHLITPPAGTTESEGAHTHTVSINTTTGSASSLPPYYALCYIMKL